MIDFGLNLLAEFVFLILVVFIGWILLRFRRRKLLRFFGVDRSGRLVLYWSGLAIRRGGAVGADGRPRSYHGQAVPFGEALFLPVFQGLFNYFLPGAQDQPGVLSKLLLSDAVVQATITPDDVRQIDSQASIVSFGSPGYNEVSRWIEQDRGSLGRFTNDNSEISVAGGTRHESALNAFVQRVRIGDADRRAFYVAGMSEIATKGAAHFLATRWDYLAERFGNRENFCVVIHVSGQDYRHHSIVAEHGEDR